MQKDAPWIHDKPIFEKAIDDLAMAQARQLEIDKEQTQQITDLRISIASKLK